MVLTENLPSDIRRDKIEVVDYSCKNFLVFDKFDNFSKVCENTVPNCMAADQLHGYCRVPSMREAFYATIVLLDTLM